VIISGGAGDGTLGDRRITSATYDGVATTSLWSQDATDWTANGARYLVAPNTTVTATVIANFGGSALQAAAGSVSYTGVDQTTPLGTPATAGGNTGQPTVGSIVSAVGDMVFASLSTDSETITESGTLEWERENVGADTAYSAQTYSGAASVTPAWTHTAPNNWAMGAVNVKASGGAPAAASLLSFRNPMAHMLVR
jgi:hypothetical protein